jgi:hypothetical protein
MDIIELKRRLYSALLNKCKTGEITDTELNIMYELSHDADIQKLFQARTK